jgi:flagellar motor protein MotB
MKHTALLVCLLSIFLAFTGCKPGKGADAGLRAELDKARLQNENLQRQIDELRIELNLVSEERNAWRTKSDATLVRAKEIEALMQKMALESAELKAKLEELERRNAELESQKRTFESSLKGLEGVTVSRVGDEICVTLEDKILFDSGKAELKGGAEKTITAIAAAMKRDAQDRRIRVEGHTDSDPIKTAKTFASNWELSAARACTVLKELARNGLPEKNMSVAGFAFHRPVASNDTAQGKAKNRRVEIYILPK